MSSTCALSLINGSSVGGSCKAKSRTTSRASPLERAQAAGPIESARTASAIRPAVVARTRAAGRKEGLMILKAVRLLRMLRFAPFALLQLVISQIREHTSRQTSMRVGRSTHIERTLSLRNEQNIVLGDNVILGPYNLLWCSRNARLTVGDHALFAPYVSIFTANHGFADLQTPINDQPEVEADVHIGKGAWLGCRAVILSGVTIGDGAVVAAGAVVNKDVAPYDIVGGVPARRIGTRLPKTTSQAATAG